MAYLPVHKTGPRICPQNTLLQAICSPQKGVKPGREINKLLCYFQAVYSALIQPGHRQHMPFHIHGAKDSNKSQRGKIYRPIESRIEKRKGKKREVKNKIKVEKCLHQREKREKWERRKDQNRG